MKAIGVVAAAAVGVTTGALVFGVWALLLRPSSRAEPRSATTPGSPIPTLTSTALLPLPATLPPAPTLAVATAAAAVPSPRPAVAASPPASPVSSPAAPPAAPGGEPNVALARQIEAVLAEVAPTASAAFIGPDGRTGVGQRAAESRVAASVIKLPLVLEVFRQAEAGSLDLEERHTIRPRDVVGGSGVLQGQLGQTVTLGELARLTIVQSDNVAANVLLERVGMDRVNATLGSLGFASTRFERRFLDLLAQARGLENRASADDLARMLRGLWSRQLVSPGVSQRVLELLQERGARDPDWLGRGLPAGTPLLHLNGTLDGVRNDAGLVLLGGERAYVLVVLQDGLSNERAGEQAIEELARRIQPLVVGAGGDRLP